MTKQLTTDRLYLRRHNPGDAADIVRGIADWDVIKWLTSPPWPYGLADAEWFLLDPSSRETFAITLDGHYIGNIGLHSVDDSNDLEFGYWLAKPYWGQGLMTEAAHAVVADHFAHCDETLISGHLLGNAPSANVLGKLGFSNTHIINRHSRPQNADVTLQRMVLSRDSWLAANPLVIETPRLVIRSYGPDDVARFHAIAARPEVAQMMQSIPHPFTLDQAANWIDARKYRGRIGFCAGVFLKDGTLIGTVGLGGDPVSTMYFYDPQHWGQGYATEAHHAFLAAMFRQFAIDSIAAGTMADNAASQRVLAKLGFRKTHRTRHQPSLRLEPDTLIMYRLTRNHFGTVQ